MVIKSRSTTNKRSSLRSSCNISARSQIRKETRFNKLKPISQQRPRKQVIRIGFEKVRKERPECRSILKIKIRR